MDKTLLLPHWFKRIGWVLFIPTALFGLLMAIDGFNGFPSFLLPEAVARGELLDHLCNNIVLFGILLGVLFITCSRERIEDECIARIRLNALLGALYATFGLTLITALVLYDFEFLYFMIFNLCLLPVLFLIIEQLLLWRFRQEGRHEE